MSKIVRTLIVGSALMFALGVMPAAVFANGDDSSNSGSGSSSSGSGDENNTTDPTETENENQTTGATETSGTDLKDRLEALQQDRQDNKQHRLEANKLRVCELRKTKITAILSRSVTRAENQLALFTKISDRVKAFYVEKGYNVANYNDLVAAADAAKAKAQTNLETLKNLEPFDCNGSDPKGQIEAFKLARKSVNQDLKDYRTAIKNLIVAVKSAQSTTAHEQEGNQ